jgi:hypothetical protein
MRRNWLSLLCVLLILIISAADIFYFGDAVNVPETRRKFFHIVFLALVMGIGYIPFTISNIKWTRQIWLACYGIVFLIILSIGGLNKVFHFSPGFMDEIFQIRVWFCSPLPFMAIFVLTKLKGMKPAESK